MYKQDAEAERCRVVVGKRSMRVSLTSAHLQADGARAN